MKWSAMVEFLVQKDIEGVIGILKKRFLLLKHFNSLSLPSKARILIVPLLLVAFYTANILLKEDGFLEHDLPDLPLGRSRAQLWITQQEDDPRGHVVATS